MTPTKKPKSAAKSGRRRLAGGCLCKALRYRVVGTPVDAGYCHCSLCRRSAGAPVLAWGTFPASAFAFTRGTPTAYHSSRRAVREFCARCGTQLTFRKIGRATLVDVNLGSLDDPEAIAPQYHIWTANRLRWFDTRDQLPRHRTAGPDVLA
jgi:hypothetical protein